MVSAVPAHASQRRAVAKAAGDKVARNVRAAGKHASTAARVTGKVAAGTAKAATKAILPAVPVAAEAVKNQRQIRSGAVSLGKAVARGNPKAIGIAAGLAPTIGRKAASFFLPLYAGAVAGKAIYDAMQSGKDVEGAAESGAYAAGDVILGGALSEYDKQRAQGESRATSIVTATLTGIDNRFLLGMGSALLEKVSPGTTVASLAHNAIDGSGQNQVANSGGDQRTRAIVEHAASGADKVVTPGAATGDGGKTPARLTPDQQKRFAIADAAFKRPAQPQQVASNDQPSGQPRGWSPQARIAAYQARNPGGANVPYGGNPQTAPNYQEPKTKP